MHEQSEFLVTDKTSPKKAFRRIPQNIFLRQSQIVAKIVTPTAIELTNINPKELFAQGTSTFIPHALVTSVGSDMTIVTVAKNFMTMDRLFEIIDA